MSIIASLSQALDLLPHGQMLVLRGYLVTHADGTEARLPADKTRADFYAATHAGRTVEAMYVLRPSPILPTPPTAPTA